MLISAGPPRGGNAVSGPEGSAAKACRLAINAACTEIWSGVEFRRSVCCQLTALSVIEALDAHGRKELKSIYLAKLVSGEWNRAR